MERLRNINVLRPYKSMRKMGLERVFDELIK